MARKKTKQNRSSKKKPVSEVRATKNKKASKTRATTKKKAPKEARSTPSKKKAVKKKKVVSKGTAKKETAKKRAASKSDSANDDRSAKTKRRDAKPKRSEPFTTVFKSTSHAKAIRRVCILTGGGDAPGLNAVVRAFVKTATESGIEVYGAQDGFDGLIRPGRLVKLNRASVRGILPRGGSILGCSNRANPFSYPSESKPGKTLYQDVSDVVVRRLSDHDVDALVLVGGDGTMSMGLRFMQMGVPVIGVPKTIDNDLGATDMTFGFDTAVTTATWAIDALHSTAEAHDRCMIVEVMGRYAGWIALCAGLAGGADVILLPEIPYDVERVAKKIRKRSGSGATFSIVVVGEGAHPDGAATSTISKGAKGHLPRLGGAGHQLAALLENRIRSEIRVTVLGHLQRGGSPSAYDRVLGTRFGVKAARLCAQGRVGRMVALRGTQIRSMPIEEAVSSPKLVPPDGELIATAKAVGIEVGQ